MSNSNITFYGRLHCDGMLSSTDTSIPISNFKIYWRKYHYEQEIRFSAHLSDEYVELIDSLFNAHKLTFIGNLYRTRIVSAECYIQRSSRDKIEGIVYKLDINVKPCRQAPVRQLINVALSPTSLALPELSGLVRHWTGEIKGISEDNDRRVMKIFTPFGVGEFTEHKEHEEVEVEGLKSIVQIPVPRLTINVEKQSLTDDVHSLLDRVSKYLIHFESLVSFLSRRQVRWIGVEVVSEHDKMTSESILVSQRLRNCAGTDEPRDDLIVSARLQENDLDAMLKILLASPYKEPIKHTINYLNSHWKDGSIESRLSGVFTAFETIINGISAIDGTELSLTNEQFNALRCSLKEQIKLFSVENNIDKEERKLLYGKLSELKRRPIVARANEIIRRRGVEWNDLWPGSSSLEGEIRSAYERRSRFIHAGKIANYGDAIADTQKIHALTERLIYGLINGQKTWLHPLAYKFSRWISL